MPAATAQARREPRLTPIEGAVAAIVIVPGQYYAQYLDGEQEHIKPISPASALRALRHEDIDTGWLAPGVVRVAETKKGTMVLSYRPPSPSTILLATRAGEPESLAVPLPGLVMIGVESKYYLFATKGKTFNPTSVLFNPPLPNINADGSICFGSNKLPQASAQAVTKVWDLFYESPFNEHSVQAKSLSNLKDIRPVLRGLARSRRKTEYPEADLVKFEGYEITVTKAWDSLRQYDKIY